jgi:uncharacterized protein YegL
MASIKAPFNELSHRAPIDLITVIDRSGSMEGEKLSLVIQALTFIIRQLQSKDKLAVVTYDDKVAVPLNITSMTAEGKNNATSKVKGIRAGSSTDLCSGLVEGIKVCNSRKDDKNEVSSLLLFTDGLANYGIQKSDEIIKELTKYDPLPCTIYTFGFGSDHDPNLLKAISDKGNGVYAFITDKDTIATAFADCLGGLLSVVAQNIQIQIQPLNGIIISKINTNFKYEESNGIITITIGDIQSEEEKDILFSVKLPQISEPCDCPLLLVKLAYFDVIHSSQIEKEISLQIRRDDSVHPKVNLAVDRQKNRIIAAESITKAKTQGDAGNIANARQILTDAMTILKNSPTGGDEYVKSLLTDLEDCKSSLKDPESYRSRGTQQMATYYSSHSYQRACHSVQTYSNTSRATMRQQLEDDDN